MRCSVALELGENSILKNVTAAPRRGENQHCVGLVKDVAKRGHARVRKRCAEGMLVVGIRKDHTINVEEDQAKTGSVAPFFFLVFCGSSKCNGGCSGGSGGNGCSGGSGGNGCSGGSGGNRNGALGGALRSGKDGSTLVRNTLRGGTDRAMRAALTTRTFGGAVLSLGCFLRTSRS